jgi:hypothetical protein
MLPASQGLSSLGSQPPNSPSNDADAPAVCSATLADATSAGAQSASAEIADSLIRSMLGGSAKPTAGKKSEDPLAPSATKQLPVTADPTLPMFAPVATAPAIRDENQPAVACDGSGPSHSSAPSSVATGAARITVSAPFAKSDTAFTAVLTPVKEATDTTRSSVAAGTGEHLSTTIAAAAEAPAITAATPTQAPAANDVSAQSSTLAVDKNPGSEMQQGGDSPQHRDEQAPASGKATVSSDAKAKPASSKLDDGSATIALDPAPATTGPLAPFPDQARPPAATGSSTGPSTPPRSGSEYLRAVEPNLPEAQQPRTGVAQEIAIRIERADSAPIDLRVVERLGQVHVDVRTNDADMQASLRGDLGTLTNSLERAGYHSETFTPAAGLGRAAPSSQTGNQDDSQDSSQGRSGQGDFSGERRQQQHQKRSSNWLEELDDQQ